ncbi:MAG TPA: hypothetical protein VG034_12215 [Acidimicrobiia bacterium]|jgi:hypothetical protein|nr:hypothetical protein [Acidimicrobiia bacterium]
MQETSLPPDTGFVVEWQLADDAGTVIDLSTAETDVFLPDDATILVSPFP